MKRIRGRVEAADTAFTVTENSSRESSYRRRGFGTTTINAQYQRLRILRHAVEAFLTTYPLERAQGDMQLEGEYCLELHGLTGPG